VIRLRHWADATLRHPLVGPLLLLALVLLLAFVVLHGFEHGVEGELVTCGMLAAAVLRLFAIACRRRDERLELARLPARSPPPAARSAARLQPAPLPLGFLLPLRR